MKVKDIIYGIIGLIIVVGIITLIVVIKDNNSKHKYSCHDDEMFDNGFVEAMRDYGLNIDINSPDFEKNYEDAYNSLIDKDVITKNYDIISNEQIYISGYIAAVKSFGFDSTKIDINFDVDIFEYCVD